MTRSFQHYDQLARQTAGVLYLYVDIETIPSQDPAVLDAIRAKHVVSDLDLSAVEADKRLKDPEKIEEDLARKRQKAVDDHAAAVAKAEVDIDAEWRKTALDATTGHIVCSSFGLSDSPVLNRYNEACDPFHLTRNQNPVFGKEAISDRHQAHYQIIDSERGMLIELFYLMSAILGDHAENSAISALEAAGRDIDTNISSEVALHREVPVVVAHFAQFDVRYIWQRAIILGVTPPSWWPIDARPWDTERVFDTMTAWAGTGNRIGLDRLCKALGLPGKTGVDGSMVWDLVKAGRIADVVSYCDDDVRRLRSVHRRMIGLPLLEIDAIEVPAPSPEVVSTLRSKAGLSVTALAKAVGTNAMVIRKLESVGMETIKAETAQALGKVLGSESGEAA